MKTTIFELLRMIKDGKAPKKIVFEHREWEWFEEVHDYWVVHKKENEADWALFIDEMHKYYNGVQDYLNDEVEILEEEKKIPEKLEQIMSKRGKYNSIDELAEEVFKAFETIDYLIINQNQLIDYLKSKGNK